MRGYGREVVVSKPLRCRLRMLVALTRENPRQAARVVARRAIAFLSSFSQLVTDIISLLRRPDESIGGIAKIHLRDATALNAGRCSIVGEGVTIVTDPQSGGYSALVPVTSSERYDGPAILQCQVDVLEGSIGLAATRSDHNLLISERAAGRLGLQQVDIIVPSLRDVAAILVRNFAMTGCASRANISSVTASKYSAEKILNMRRDRPSNLVRLPLRKYACNKPLQKHVGEVITPQTIDTATAAAIIIDVWDTLGESREDSRWESNISEKLLPTLAALRSSGMAIVHAAHDRPIHELVRPLDGETVIQGEIMDTDFICNALRDSGIRHLFYMGYVSNKCILMRSIGMLEMVKRGFNVTLVRDASLAVETGESISGEWFHKATVHFVESNIGTSVTAAEIQTAVRAACIRSEPVD